MYTSLKKYAGIMMLSMLMVTGALTFLPHHTFAAGLVPDCNLDVGANGNFTHECGLDDIMQLANNVINFLLFYISAPIAAILFAYAGFLYMTSGGDSGKRGKAHGIFGNVVVGFLVAMAAWLIVHVITSVLGYDGSWVGL